MVRPPGPRTLPQVRVSFVCFFYAPHFLVEFKINQDSFIRHLAGMQDDVTVRIVDHFLSTYISIYAWPRKKLSNWHSFFYFIYNIILYIYLYMCVISVRGAVFSQQPPSPSHQAGPPAAQRSLGIPPRPPAERSRQLCRLLQVTSS